MKVALDHHLSRRIAESMRQRGVDAVAALERDWHRLDDAGLLDQCAAEGRALITGDVADVVPIALRWTAEGRAHAGLILVSNSAIWTRRDSIGQFVTALLALAETHPADDALVDRVVWIRPPAA